MTADTSPRSTAKPPAKEEGRQGTTALVLQWVSRILAIASVLNLVYHGFHFGLIATIRLMLDYYERLTGFLFRPFELPLHELLSKLSTLVHLDIHLYPHWKHIFILLMVYFGARQRSMWTVGNNVGLGFRLGILSIGIIVGLVGAVAAGTLPLATDVTSMPAGMLIAAFPLAAALIFDLLENVMSATLRRRTVAQQVGDEHLSSGRVFAFLARKVVMRFTVATLVLLAIAFFGPLLPNLPNPGLIALFLLLVMTSLYWLDQGRRNVEVRRSSGEGWWHAFVRIGSTRVGVELGLIIASVVFVVAISAGLAPFGL